MEILENFIDNKPYEIIIYELKDVSGWLNIGYEPNYSPENVAGTNNYRYETESEWKLEIVRYIRIKNVLKCIQGIFTCVMICSAN